MAGNAADLLEVGELRDLHAIEPHLPAQAPGAERGVFPVVFHKAHVVFLQVKTQRAQAAQVQIQDVVRRGLEHHLVLVVVLKAVGVVAVAAIFWAAAGLHVGGFPRLRADGAQKGGRVAGARAHFHVIRLQKGAALIGPVFLEGKDDLLEAEHGDIRRVQAPLNG